MLSIWQYRKYAFENYKTEVISKLEKYRDENSSYPDNLSIINFDEKYDIRYYVDSLKQNFILSYSSGFIGCNANKYDSQTKKWTIEFVY